MSDDIPFRLTTKNGLTPQEEAEILTASKEARAGKNVSRTFSSVDELLDELDRA